LFQAKGHFRLEQNWIN